MNHLQFFFASGPAWLYVVLSGLCLLIGWASYRDTQPPLRSPLRWVLVALRTLGLALLLIALFEPILRFASSEERRPPILIAIDASASMKLSDGSGSRMTALKNAVAAVRSELPDAPMVWFSNVTQPLADVDSLRFDGQRTDFDQLVRGLSNYRGTERPAVVITISDGNVNSGSSPLYAAQQTGMGWYTIGIGDTANPKDVIVDNILSGNQAVVGKETTVSATVRAVGYADSVLTAMLVEDGVEVARDTIRVTTPRDQQMVSFAWTPKVAGHRKLTIRVNPAQGEATNANNHVSDYVHVRTEQRTINIFAGAPSSDVTFVKSQLEGVPFLHVNAYIQKQGGTFYVPPPSVAELSSAQSCMLIGFPNATTPIDVVQRIAQACEKGMSLLFISSRDVDYTKLRPLEPYLPMSIVSSRPTEFQVTADVDPSSTADPLLRVTGTEDDATAWNSLPPVYRTETYVSLAPGSETLATVRVNNVPLPEPLILRRSSGTSRSVAILGYGLYRWKLMSQGPASSRGNDVADVFNAFVTNCVTWLSVDDQEQRVRIKPTHMFYAAGEAVTFQGQVADESLIPVEQADVRVTVSSKTLKREVLLANLGNGRYSSVIGALPAGDYMYRGSASKNGKGLGIDVGRFSVGDLGIESSSTRQDVALLSSLATRTGAQYGTATQATDIAKAAMNDARRRPRAITSEHDRALWHLPWMLVAVITAFATEWFIRKRSGLV